MKSVYHEINDIADQLGRAVTGTFNFSVRAEGNDQTLQKLTIMLNFLLETSRRAIEDRENKGRELEYFASVASHDLREPIRTMTNFLQILRLKLPKVRDPQCDEYLNTCLEAAGRMTRLIEGILNFSMVGRGDRKKAAVDCDSVFRNAIANLTAAIEETRATVRASRLPIVPGVEVELTQLFQNLIANAIKFRGKAPPIVDIHADRQQTQWRFSIIDNGIGMEPESANKIFIAFRRLESGRHHGVGLGLAVCKKIVEGHGGRIWVDSAPGKGSTFYFTLAG